MGSRALVALAALGACTHTPSPELRQGGDTTVDDRTATAFTHPVPNLTLDQTQTFLTGQSTFGFHWFIPQLGPMFNNDACAGCHLGNGRGAAQIGSAGTIADMNGPESESLVRTSLGSGSADPSNPGGPIPVPGYGTQLHDHDTDGVPQAIVTLAYTEQTFTYPDGATASLRTPTPDIRAGNSAPWPDGILFSYRTAPPIIGLGLLAAVDPTLAADPTDADGDGISGTLNMVWDPLQQATVLGRFGWKANVSTLELQSADAANGDIGLTTEVFPNSDGTTDMPDDQFEPLTFFVAAIAVPAAADRDDTAEHGRELFDDFGCAKCHTPTQVTGASAIPGVANQTIHPYTDLLLHDMGSALSDDRPDFAAQGFEWRTPPLWGIGLVQVVAPTVTFLHDGRARTLEEAILWHGGEAQAAHDAFVTAAASDRDALLAFLATL